MKRNWQYARIGKEYEFSAAHRLMLLDENHPCYRLHGHNYKVEIEVRGDVMQKTGFCNNVDFRDLDKLLKPLVNKLDHQYLNDFIENPSAENIALWFLNSLRETYIYSVKIWETPKCWAMVVNDQGLFHAVHKE